MAWKRGLKQMNDFPVSGLRVVTVRYKNFNTGFPSELTTYYMHKSQVEEFVAAQIKLHFEPGVNPYNGNVTAGLWAIWVKDLNFNEPKSFWWCSRNLEGTDGAKIIDLNWGARVFAHPDLLSQEENEPKSE